MVVIIEIGEARRGQVYIGLGQNRLEAAGWECSSTGRLQVSHLQTWVVNIDPGHIKEEESKVWPKGIFGFRGIDDIGREAMGTQIGNTV